MPKDGWLWQDPLLPHLRVATDPAAMTQIFAGRLQSALRSLHAEVESCALDWLQYRRSRRCRVLYRVVFRGAAGEKFEHWFYGKLFRRLSQAQREYDETRAAATGGPWPPVALWPELDMVIWAFPNDPAMPALQQAADPDFVRAQINAGLPAFGLPGDWRTGKVEIGRIKYMPGKRCVLRCQALVHNKNGESAGLKFYSKTYREGLTGARYRSLLHLQERLGSFITVPRFLAHFEQAGTFWQQAWEGRALIEVFSQTAGDDLLPRVAGMLAALHQSPCSDLPRRDALEKAFESVQEDAATIAALVPRHRTRCEAALTALAAAKQELAAQSAPLVPTHGTFRLEQILVRADEMALVDLDEAALSDPWHDVAEFLSSLQFLEFTHGLARARLQQAADNFQANYAKQAPWPWAPQRVAWYAAASLLDKIHETLRRLDFPALEQIDAMVDLVEQWLEPESCMNRAARGACD